jgi:hypothetical protein
MIDKKTKIIVITDYPFNTRDYDRFGIETFRKNGFEVEIWDITSYLHKKHHDQLIRENSDKYKGLRRFSEKSEIIHAIAVLDKKCIINYLIEYSHRTFFIFKAISRYKISYCVMVMESFTTSEPVQNCSFGSQIKYMMKKGFSLKLRTILEHLINKTLIAYYPVFGIAPASLIILAGEKSAEISPYPVDADTVRVWTHIPDYDIYLRQKDEINDFPKFEGIFLDQYLPMHPDFLHMGADFPFTPDAYYPKVCNFFSILEKNMKLQIVIAAHPRSDYEHSPEYFEGRTIIKGKTADMVRNCSFVITHTSTSLDFAVLYNKPVIFITTDILEKMTSGKNNYGSIIQSKASVLGKTPINIDHVTDFDWASEMKIDQAAYLRHKNLYIKKEGTPEKPLWEIYCSYIH